MSEARFRINAENVVHEMVDGEVIVIDLTNGSYYSLSGSGPAIWEMLAGGAGPVDIRAALESRFDAEPGAIETAVTDLIVKLEENNLILVDGSGPIASAPAAANGNGAREPFAPPLLEHYTDMKDYFLLDPIHEVSPAAGWPKPAG